jgi:hypothetical protein
MGCAISNEERATADYAAERDERIQQYGDRNCLCVEFQHGHEVTAYAPKRRARRWLRIRWRAFEAQPSRRSRKLNWMNVPKVRTGEPRFWEARLGKGLGDMRIPSVAKPTVLHKPDVANEGWNVQSHRSSIRRGNCSAGGSYFFPPFTWGDVPQNI